MVQQSTNNIFENVYKFNGKELDESTGYYYYGARYYDPSISIFLSVDPLAEQFPNYNPYTYTMNNPVNLVDPTGMAPEGSDWIPGTDGKSISYTKNEKGEITWSSNTSNKFKQLGNAMLQTTKGKAQLDKALLSQDVKIDVAINEGRREGESGVFNSKITFGYTTPLSVDDKDNPTKITSGRIDLYPKAYSDILESEYADYIKVSYDGESFSPSKYSIDENLSTTFGHEIEHIFDSNSSSHLNKLQRKSSDTEAQPNKVSKEIYQQLNK